MPAVIQRSVTGPKTLTIAADDWLTPMVDVSCCDKALVFVPLGWNGADLTFKAAAQSNEDRLPDDQLAVTPTYADIRDEVGLLVRITPVVPGAWHVVPSKALSCKYLKFQSTNVGSDAKTNQANARALVLLQKS